MAKTSMNTHFGEGRVSGKRGNTKSIGKRISHSIEQWKLMKSDVCTNTKQMIEEGGGEEIIRRWRGEGGLLRRGGGFSGFPFIIIIIIDWPIDIQ